MDLTPDQLQALIDAAVQAKTDEIRSELQAQLETSQVHDQSTMLSKAANEGLVVHTDPGNGYEYAVIPLDKIDYNPLSKRTEEELDPNSIGMKQLIKDIQVRNGLNRPLLVYRQKDENEGRYMLVKGSRRLAALKAMGQELNHAYILPAKPPLDMEENWVNGY